MNLSKILLSPFSLLYGGITSLRNSAFDKGIKPQFKACCPVISVGNLSVGGTGKSPMVEWLIFQFEGQYDILVISRGYGRKTKGLFEVEVDDTSDKVGDEPLQIKRKYPNIKVVVSEKRQNAVEQFSSPSKNQLIILDDALQHRYVQRDVNIVLSAYDNLFYKDHVLPMGRLREWRSGIERGDALVVTKCPKDFDLNEISEQVKNYSDLDVFFTRIKYGKQVYNNDSSLALTDLKKKPILLLSGIAKPEFFENYIGGQFDKWRFSDHHNFSANEISQIKEILKDRYILTTEKDYMRLKNYKWTSDELGRIYYLPISVEFMENKASRFKDFIQSKLGKN
ncbi:tetraacyldisaccharide 4'-kinase [Flavobacteriaceae bacterium]|nr:tetraacyldisaccharide 4'-kinase [Flavobacteriaceae bacterium]